MRTIQRALHELSEWAIKRFSLRDDRVTRALISTAAIGAVIGLVLVVILTLTYENDYRPQRNTASTPRPASTQTDADRFRQIAERQYASAGCDELNRREAFNEEWLIEYGPASNARGLESVTVELEVVRELQRERGC